MARKPQDTETAREATAARRARLREEHLKSLPPAPAEGGAFILEGGDLVRDPSETASKEA